MSLSKYRFFGYAFVLNVLFFSELNYAAQVAPVDTITPLISVTKGEHIVTEGETLYSIAWRYNRDLKELAALNNIAPPYYLKIGQCLNLQSTKSAVVPNLPGWHWPATGTIIKTFSNEFNKAFNKGIDIAGQLGTPILAAMPGKVVYSGSGLKGLGQLLIIKHDNHFLSAYAHNQELMVKEGQYVKQGEVVAKMGNTDSNTAKLHFEIRYKGLAVNPLNYLPPPKTISI